MGQIPMPGGWTMSAIWLPMCGQSWIGAAAGFVRMWALTMVPMMLPLAVRPLRRYRATLVGVGRWRARLLAAVAGFAWAAAWTAPALPLWLAGTAVAHALPDLPALARMVPVLAAVAGVAGAGWHAASWYGRPLHAAAAPGRPAVAAALRQGARIGGHCVRRCAGMTVAMVAAGFMETGTMVCALAVVAVECMAAELVLRGRPA